MTIFSALRRRMRRLRKNTSGNAALLVALATPAMIGAGGLAVDTAQWYMWKRELQHSVDQAAIGAAWALSNDSSKDNYRKRALQEFDANQSMTMSFADTPTIALANYAGGTDNSVIVSATATRKLPFSSFLTQNSVTVRVRAQARFEEGMNYNACLVALAGGAGSFEVGGSATVKARCGLAALSCEADAITISGSATVVTDSIATCGTASVPETMNGVVNQNVAGLQDIYKDLTPPDNPTPQTVNCKSTGTGSNKTNQASLSPGTYKGGLVVKCSTVLSPGIYVIDGGELDLSANYDVTGAGVMFVLKNGARLKFGGNGNDNRITLSPMQASQFVGTPYESQKNDLQGILVFEDRNNKPENPGHLLNGNSNSLIEGLIYLPSGEMTVLGTANIAAQCLQISAYKMHIAGNAKLETLCPIDESTVVGHSVAKVRLVV